MILIYFLQLLAIVYLSLFFYVGDNTNGLRGHHLLHQQKDLAAYATDQNSDQHTRADASLQLIEDLCNL